MSQPTGQTETSAAGSVQALGAGRSHGHDHGRDQDARRAVEGAHHDHDLDEGGGDDHGHHHGDDAGAPHSTLRGYMTGFLLSVVLTAIPFWMVMAKVFDKPATTAFVILGIAAVQIVVHMIYFLHMSGKAEGGWSMLAMLFTLVLVVITLSGSLWVMFHLNHNMMPAAAHDMRNMP